MSKKYLQTDNKLLNDLDESQVNEIENQESLPNNNYDSAAKLLSIKQKDSVRQSTLEDRSLDMPEFFNSTAKKMPQLIEPVAVRMNNPRLIEPVSVFQQPRLIEPQNSEMGQTGMRWLAGLKNLAHDTTFKRRQIAQVDGEDPVGADGTEGPLSKKIAQFIRDGIENQQQLNQTPLEEPDTESGDEQEQLFSEFRFKSFRKHKLAQEDYQYLKVDEPEEHEEIKAKIILPENQLIKHSVELVGINKQQLVDQEELEQKKIEERNRKNREMLIEEQKHIKKKRAETSKQLERRAEELKKLIEIKQQRSIKEFEIKEKVLRDTFGTHLKNLIKQVRRQKEIITQSYGPLVLANKESREQIFKINPELDPDGAKWQHELTKQIHQLPQTMLVKLKSVRCLKDKVASGHFLILVHLLDRIGGTRIQFNDTKTEQQYRFVSKHLRDLAIKKREFLNKTNRTQELKDDNGQIKFVEASQTGVGFFKKQETQESIVIVDEESGKIQERPIDYTKDLLIDMERNYSRYVRFNGRAFDDNLDIDDTVSILIPNEPETTNILMFQLILLESECVPKDYTVGWGVFPLLNSDFKLNEGKYKVPLLFGEVDPDLDRFVMIEDKMKEDIDSWLANLYFELEKVNLMDLKVEPDTQRLFYKPVSGISPQEQQQLLKMHQNDVQEFGRIDPGVEGGVINNDDIDDGHDSNIEESSQSSGQDEEIETEDQANQLAEQFVEVQYDTQRTHEDINYDHYHFAVGQKYDLTNRNLSWKKFKYISDEILLDLRWRSRNSIQFQTTLAMIAALFFLRIFIHYTGQYLALVVMQVPVTQYQASFIRVQINYAAWELYQECVMLATGAFANTAVFGFLILTSIICKSWFGNFPKFWYKVVCWIGIYTVADPFLTLIFDCIAQDWNSDWFKLYNWFSKTPDSGNVGIYITLFMVLFETSISGYAFYRFMVIRYMDGRILDLYRRLSGQYKAFFVPLDNEISLKYLQWVVNRAKKRDYVILSERRTIKDKFGIDRMVNFVQILKIQNAILYKNRLFFKDFDGSLIEVPQSKIALNQKDLKKVKMMKRDNNANPYGKFKSLNELINSSYSRIKRLGLEEQEENQADLSSLAAMKKFQDREREESKVPYQVDDSMFNVNKSAFDSMKEVDDQARLL